MSGDVSRRYIGATAESTSGSGQVQQPGARVGPAPPAAAAPRAAGHRPPQRFTLTTPGLGDTGRVRRLRALPWKKIFLLGGPGVLLVLLVLFGVAYALTDVPEPNKVSQEQSTVLRYAGGEELARLGTNRQLVELGRMSDPAQKAVLAAEDRGFYNEPGISPRGIARALFTNVRGGGDVQQGGSTITQQYAKNAFLTSERTYTRKVKEVFIALKMTREQSKEQILEDYLNTIYFGRGAYGIEAASRAYFGSDVSAASLTPEQAAVLAASIRSPAGYDPVRHPERAQQRWAYVLDGMVSQGWLTPEARAAAVYPQVAPAAANSSGADLSGPTGHVVKAVQAELAARGFDEDAGGITVTTTIRQPAQAAAVKAVESLTEGDKADDALQGALVSVEPGTGRVVAYYGGANGAGIDQAGGVTLPTDGDDLVVHQPGSSFKAYVLAAALKQGISLNTTLDGNSPKAFRGREPVRNFGGSAGRVDLVAATRNSVNTAYYELAERVGPDKVAELAYAAGVSDRMSLADSSGGRTGNIALGAYEVRVTDQAVGFATFAAEGEAAAPYLVESVEQDGETVYTARPQVRRAFSADVAADATVALQAVVTSGSGTRARLAGNRPAAGKTGTTTDAKDLWFAGFTPQLASAVWIGYGTPRPVEVDGVNQATGGRLAAGVWKAYTDAALAGQPVQRFPQRANVGRVQRAPQTPRSRAPSTRAPSRAPTSPPATSPPATPPAPSAAPAPTASEAPAPSATRSAPTRRPQTPPARSVPPATRGGAGGPAAAAPR